VVLAHTEHVLSLQDPLMDFVPRIPLSHIFGLVVKVIHILTYLNSTRNLSAVRDGKKNVVSAPVVDRKH